MPWKNLRRFFSKLFKQPVYALRVLALRGRAFLYYIFSPGRSSLPEAVTLFLTHRCNLHCKMCGQWGESGVTKKMSSGEVRREMSFEELKSLVDDIRGFRPNITLFGGEPLLHPECLKLIRYIKRKKMHCLMITNGSLLNMKAEELVEAGLDELNVSLDGARERHDEIRGMPGLFDRITGGLKTLNRIKKEKNKTKPLINLQCTITKFNYEYLEELLDVAAELEANSLTFHNLIFLDNDIMQKQREYDKVLGASSGEWEGFISRPEIDPVRLYKKMGEILKLQHKFSVDFYPNLSLEELKEYYLNPCYVPKEYPARCLSPWVVAYVFPDGGVRPCLNSSYSFGNVREKHFSEIWNSRQAVEFRKTLKNSKIFPACIRCTELYRY